MYIIHRLPWWHSLTHPRRAPNTESLPKVPPDNLNFQPQPQSRPWHVRRLTGRAPSPSPKPNKNNPKALLRKRNRAVHAHLHQHHCRRRSASLPQSSRPIIANSTRPVPNDISNRNRDTVLLITREGPPSSLSLGFPDSDSDDSDSDSAGEEEFADGNDGATLANTLDQFPLPPHVSRTPAAPRHLLRNNTLPSRTTATSNNNANSGTHKASAPYAYAWHTGSGSLSGSTSRLFLDSTTSRDHCIPTATSRHHVYRSTSFSSSSPSASNAPLSRTGPPPSASFSRPSAIAYGDSNLERSRSQSRPSTSTTKPLNFNTVQHHKRTTHTQTHRAIHTATSSPSTSTSIPTPGSLLRSAGDSTPIPIPNSYSNWARNGRDYAYNVTNCHPTTPSNLDPLPNLGIHHPDVMRAVCGPRGRYAYRNENYY